MSWWDTSNLTNLVSQGLEKAQKTIDKALDINEEQPPKGAGKATTSSRPKKNEKSSAAASGDFWNSWLGGSEPAKKQDEKKGKEAKSPTKSTETPKSPSSWTFGFSATKEETSWSSFDPSKLGVSDASKTVTSVVTSPSEDIEKPSSPRVRPEETKAAEFQTQSLFASVHEDIKTAETCQESDEYQEDKIDVDFRLSEIKDEDTSILKGDDSISENVRLEKDELLTSESSAVMISSQKRESSDEGFQGTESAAASEVETHSVSLEAGVTASEGLNVQHSDTISSMNSKTDSILSFRESDTIVSSSESGLDMSQKVMLDIPGDFTEQVGPSTPLSEASILTLSSPGQDELESQAQILSSPQTTSDYINISTTHIQVNLSEEISLYNQDTHDKNTPYTDTPLTDARSTESPSVESASPESEQADASVVEQEYLKKEQPDLGQSSGNDSPDASRLDSSADTCASGETLVDKEVLSYNEDDMGNASFVKDMLEEAMEDVSKPEDSSSDNHSGGDKSESSKGESEIDKSVSGQESSDDIETTTSSDIEIISTPTPNGDKSERLFDLSPLRIALQKSVRRDHESHRRTDSQSSGSTYSKAGDSDQMSPGRDSLERQDIDSGDDELRAPDLYAVTEEDPDSPYHPQKLLQKLAEKEEVLQHRENKLVQLSKENNDLLETNSILRNQLQQAEELREAEMTDLNTLTDEFTKRLSEAEKKLQNSIKEKEAIKRQLQTAQDELKQLSGDASAETLLAEKDEQIEELLKEGEKLSKQQLQSNNIIKKLRAKEKENESLLASQKKKLEEQKVELEHLRKVCDAKEDLEKKQTEAINQLNSAVQKQEKEILKYKSEEEDTSEKHRSLQTALDNAYKEIADLHKMNAAQGSKAQEAALSAEVAVREQLKIEMEQERLQQKHEKESLIMQIEDLRLSMSRMERESNRREDMLRQEISDLQVQLQEDEARTQELTHSVSSATRPLLRQIENLQSNYTAQSSSWEKVEKNLTERLAETRNQLAMAVEKERTSSEKLMDQNIRLTTLESQAARLRQEKSQLMAQLEMDKAKIELLEEAKLNEMAQVDVVKKQMSSEMTELKKDKVFLETQLEMERTKIDTEKKRVSLLEDQIRLMERERPRSRGTPSPVSVSRQESLTSVQSHLELLPVLPQEDLIERSLMLSSPNGSKMNLYESLRQSGAATLLENLQSQLKQREGEIIQLQSEISSLERTRESMAKELVDLTNANEELQERVQELSLLQSKYKDLDSRYNAILQMYGEKVEQAEELKLDLQDVKEMYKAQIDQLLAK